MGSIRFVRLGAVLLVLALGASGCGARLDRQQVAAANASGDAGAGTQQAGSGVGGSGAGVGATVSGAGAAGPGGLTAGAGATPAAGSARSGSSAGAGAAAGTAGSNPASLPPGGNGGATDVGVSADSIELGNVSTLTGPVPGLFKGAIVGTEAFLAYQNSLGGVYGRQLRLKVGDDRLDDGEHRAQVVNLIPQVFAFVGSFSVFDDGGATEIGQANVPDVGFALTHERAVLKQNFSVQPLPPGWRLGPLNYFKAHFGSSVITKVGAIVADVPAAKGPYAGEKAAMQSLGYQVVYERYYEATETDFTADIVRMRGAGVKMFVMQGDVASMARVAQAAQKQNFTFTLPNYGANAYDPAFLAEGGNATEGTLIDQQLAMYAGEDAASVPEVGLFEQWEHQVSPDSSPDIFAAYGWASARLFVQALQAAGPRATRATLLAQLAKIDDFDDNGLLAPAGPASKRPPVCYMLVKVQGGKFVRDDPPGHGFRCDDGGWFTPH